MTVVEEKDGASQCEWYLLKVRKLCDLRSTYAFGLGVVLTK